MTARFSRLTTLSARVDLALKKAELLNEAQRTLIHRIPVYAVLEHESLVPLCFAKIRRALDCVIGYDPRRFQRFRKDLKRILVSRYEGTHFLPPLRMIVLYWPSIAPKSPEEIAVHLVHEATHARHHARGISYLPELRARAEAACLAQEVEFAKKLPGGLALVDQRMSALERPWWTPEAFSQRELRKLRDLGVPSWLYRIVEAAHTRRFSRLEVSEPAQSTAENGSSGRAS